MNVSRLLNDALVTAVFPDQDVFVGSIELQDLQGRDFITSA